MFLARGSLANGFIQIVPSEEVTDVVKVDVVVSYFRTDIRDEAKVCVIRREDDETGVAILACDTHFD